MLLVYDIESTGKRKDGLAASDPSQPMPVQIGAQLFDQQYNRVGHMKHLIQPDGWSIEPEAEAIHGISETMAHRYGVRLDSALIIFADMVAKAQRIVAFNSEFDRFIISAALARIGAAGKWWTGAAGKFFCAMEAATPLCRRQGKFGDKFPTLKEAIDDLCTDVDFQVMHDADNDIAGTLALYRELERRGVAGSVNPFRRSA